MSVGTPSRAVELHQAVQELRSRGMAQAACWAAELLLGLGVSSIAQQQNVACRSETASNAYLLALQYFDGKEYRRAAQVLQAEVGARPLFLRAYATYLAGEQRREEEQAELHGPYGKASVANKELDAVMKQLQAAVGSGSADAFALYLLGLVHLDRGQPAEAQAVLLTSLSSFPCNWSAWQALQTASIELGSSLGGDLPHHWMREFYLAAWCLAMQENEEALGRLGALSQLFPSSDWVVWQAATAHYNLRNFDDAQELFEDLLERDPERLEGMDTYSNMLYVKESFPALSHLAHRVALTAKYRPETCCIIGNYYSLKGQHEKAVVYFRRALKLNPRYTSAWTLMGHEYVEMKNPPAAIEAYRHAVETNPRDYRAWYGLGNTYELLHMPYYALYYFRQATQLKEGDARMWIAMAQCYESEQLRQSDRTRMEAAAIQCYKRAVQAGDREGIALHKLAKLHQARGDAEQAAQYHRANLERIEAENITGSDQLDALLFLAEYAKDVGRLAEAEGYCMQLLDHSAPSKDRAKSLLREVRSLQRHQQAAAEAAAGRRSMGSGFVVPAPVPMGSPPFSPDGPASMSPGSDL